MCILNESSDCWLTTGLGHLFSAMKVMINVWKERYQFPLMRVGAAGSEVFVMSTKLFFVR